MAHAHLWRRSRLAELARLKEMTDRELVNVGPLIAVAGDTQGETKLSGSSNVEGHWNETEYCLYRYTPNHQYEWITEGLPSAQSNEPDPVHGSGFSSLSLIGSSIASDREHFLREQIANKMSQGSLYCGSGQVTSLTTNSFPQPSQVYYCLMEAAANDSDHAGSSITESGLTSPLRVDSKRQYVVCFATLGKTGLELFRTELDGYCAILGPLLPNKSTELVIQSFQGSTLQSKMSDWYNQRVEYMSRVVKLCQKVLPKLLHVAIDSKVEVTGPNECNVRDVKLFLETCSMASLMQFEEKKITPTPLARNLVTITVSHNSCTLSSDETSQFCSNWAQVLLARGTSNPDPFFLKQAVENYKLKLVQDLNAFKRLLREAESDYHALYRTYLFLSVCGNGKLLLQCVLDEAASMQSASTLAVLQVLQTFSQKNGFRKPTSSK